jgi:hypothetical protein
MASGLAAEMNDKFGITPELLDGHNGIYEVNVNGNVLYTNGGKCSQLPANEEVLVAFRQYKDLLPGKAIDAKKLFPMFTGGG